MNKLALVLVLLAVAAVSVSAGVVLVSPVSKQIAANSAFSIGKVMPGQTFEIVVSNSDGRGGLWNILRVVPESLPLNWKIVKSESFAESLTVQIKVPETESEKRVRLAVQLSNAGDSLKTQEVSLDLVVANDLVKLDLVPLQNNVLTGETVSFRLIAINDSIAEQPIVIRSDLPVFWFEPFEFSLGPAFRSSSRQERVLTVFPRTYGERKISFWADSMLNHKNLAAFSSSLTVHPTLASKFQSGLFGWPAFTPNLSVFYFFNALIGSLQ